MRDKGPGHAEHAGVSGERPDGEFRQLPVIARRQIRADFANLFFDEMIIVDQPFRGRRDRATLVGSLQQALVGGEQAGSVLGEAPRQRMPPLWLRRHFLGRRQTSRMFLDAFGAEKFFPNGLRIIPGRRRAREQAVQKYRQLGLKSEIEMDATSSIGGGTFAFLVG